MHFLAFSALVGWLGKWQLESVTDSFQLTAWVWVGLASFWTEGFGVWLLAGCMVGVGIVVIAHLIRWIALSRRRQELEEVLRKKEEQLKVSLHEEITRQVIAEQTERKEFLDEYKEHLNQGYKDLSFREAEAEALQKSALFWKEELRDIQRKMAAMREKRKKQRQRAGWALDALDAQPPKLDEAKRHLKRLVRNR